jgi:alpha-D-ribose 1-methylphosphonate 5-triphosphate synthase subunit PhnH
MARPGTVRQVPQHSAGGDMAGALSVLEALVDHEVTFAVVPSMPEVSEAILRLTGSRIAAPGAADYVLCRQDSLAEAIEGAKTGLLEYPDRGATVVCQVQAVSDGESLRLYGPGVDGETEVEVRTFAPEARAAFLRQNEERPLGVDLVLVDSQGRITCLNRYTGIKEG